MQTTRSVVVGIDLGSTSTRVYLWDPAKANWDHPVENPKRNNLSSRFEKGDFSSTGYPFDGGPVYLGESRDISRQSTSLKFGMYPLAGCKDSILQQYVLLNPLLDMADDQEFRTRLKNGLHELFKVLYTHVAEVCTRKRLSITAIGLSIPSQWDLDFERVYRDIVAAEFHEPPEKIFFHTETEALAHYLFNQEPELLDIDDNIILFLDFGGHNMNGCMFSVSHNKDGGVCFYRYDEPFGAGGGSEHWEYLIGVRCMREIKKMHKMAPSFKELQAFLDEFNMIKSEIGPHTDCPLELWVKGCQVNIDAPRVSQLFHKAMRHPIELAATKIRQLGRTIQSNNRRQSKGRVIVCGGSSKHEALQIMIRRMCADEKLPDPIFATSMGLRYDSMKIARGTAYAVGSSVTIEQFFAQGAAIGLQTKQAHTERNSNPEGDWDDTAQFLYSKANQEKLRFYANGSDETMLVCQPYFENGKAKELHHDRCYNLLYIGKLAQGHWQLDLDTTGSGNDMELVLNHARKPNKSNRFQRVRRTLPLYFDRGTSCVHVGKPGCTVEEGIEGPLGLGTGPRMEEEAMEDCVTVQTDLKPEPPERTGNTESQPKEGEEVRSITPGFKPCGSLLGAPRVLYYGPEPPAKRQRTNQQQE